MMLHPDKVHRGGDADANGMDGCLIHQITRYWMILDTVLMYDET